MRDRTDMIFLSSSNARHKSGNTTRHRSTEAGRQIRHTSHGRTIMYDDAPSFPPINKGRVTNS